MPTTEQERPDDADGSSALPAGVDRDRHLDLRGRGREPWVRRVIMLALAAVVVAALLDAFGQGLHTRTTADERATLEVTAPDAVRAGLFFQARFDIVATSRVERPRLVLDRGWAEELQINTIEPAPQFEDSEDGRLELGFGPLPTGRRLTVWMQFEANPTGAGNRDQGVELRDGSDVLLAQRREFRIYP